MMNDQDGSVPQLFAEEIEVEEVAAMPSDENAQAQKPDVDTSSSLENNTQATSGANNTQAKGKRKVVQRSFPAVPFEEALDLPLAIQRLASGHRLRRVRLFELLERSPDSSVSRMLITNANRYGMTSGSYAAEWLELTDDGRIATSDEVPQREKMRIRFKLAIEQIQPFKMLYDQFVNGRLPAKSVMADALREKGLHADEVAECVETFLLNLIGCHSPKLASLPVLRPNSV